MFVSVLVKMGLSLSFLRVEFSLYRALSQNSESALKLNGRASTQI